MKTSVAHKDPTPSAKAWCEKGLGCICKKSGICGSKVGTFPYKVNTFPYMVIIANVCWRDNNRNPQIFGGTALKKVGLLL
jgi:hypothetical protein